MRRLVFERFGEPSEVLRLDQAAVPEPGPDEARIRVSARPIGPADLMTIRGEYGRYVSLPAVPGYEAAGRVDAIGGQVANVAPGQRVVPLGTVGTWQETIIVPASALLPIPDAMPDAVACQIIENPLTAYLLLLDVCKARPGDWVVQTAAGSAVGRLIMQLARLNGINLVNIVRSSAGAAQLTTGGAENVLASEEGNLCQRITAIAGKNVILNAVDAVGGETGAEVAEALAYGGQLIVYGALARTAIPLSPARLIFKSISVRGFWVTDWMRLTAQEQREKTIDAVVKLVAMDKLTPLVEAEFDLGDYAAALARDAQPGRAGKVILTG